MRVIRTAGWITVWGAALYGTLQIARLNGPWDHAICGPWGCGPPLSALVACHAFWTVLIGGVVTLGIANWSASTLSITGRVLAVCGLLALVAVAVWEGVHWPPSDNAMFQHYLVQRYLFVLATSIDTPIVELAVAGGALFVAGRGKQTANAETRDMELGTDR